MYIHAPTLLGTRIAHHVRCYHTTATCAAHTYMATLYIVNDRADASKHKAFKVGTQKAVASKATYCSSGLPLCQ